MRVRFVAKTAGLVRPDSGLQMLNAEHGIGDITSADILLVPGGDASGPIQDQDVLDWIRRIDRTTKWTTSVCVGSLILGAAGLLKGVPATSHWNTLQDLRYFGAQSVEQRFIRHGKIMTAAGVSAGIDMALQLVAIEYGEDVAKSVQLLIEYDPHPPLDSGSTAKAIDRDHRSCATDASRHVRPAAIRTMERPLLQTSSRVLCSPEGVLAGRSQPSAAARGRAHHWPAGLPVCSANACATLNASDAVPAYEMFDVTATTIPRSRNVINDATIPPRDAPSWPTTRVGSPASVAVSMSQPRP
jgi:putative intracellular protease/amidase